MSAFNTITAIAAPLPEDNIDTDSLYPARFLLKIDKNNIGDCLFYDRRFRKNGDENPEFVLNQPGYRQSPILIGGTNFGCGSSREHAPWALADFGIRCVIAQSFGEIFYNNCINNRILPIVVSKTLCSRLVALARQRKTMTVDLQQQRLCLGDNRETPAFTLSANHRDMLLNGLDEITLQLQNDTDDIDRFEAQQRKIQPWLWEDKHLNL